MSPTFKRRVLPAASLAALAAVAQADPRIVGEWAVEAADCDEYRIVYEPSGEGFAMLYEEGEWRNVGGAIWRVDGNLLHESRGTESSVAEIIAHDAGSVTLVNRSSSDMQGQQVTFRRCPPR